MNAELGLSDQSLAVEVSGACSGASTAESKRGALFIQHTPPEPALGAAHENDALVPLVQLKSIDRSTSSVSYTVQKREMSAQVSPMQFSVQLYGGGGSQPSTYSASCSGRPADRTARLGRTEWRACSGRVGSCAGQRHGCWTAPLVRRHGSACWGLLQPSKQAELQLLVQLYSALPSPPSSPSTWVP